MGKRTIHICDQCKKEFDNPYKLIKATFEKQTNISPNPFFNIEIDICEDCCKKMNVAQIFKKRTGY